MLSSQATTLGGLSTRELTGKTGSFGYMAPVSASGQARPTPARGGASAQRAAGTLAGARL